MRGLFGRSGRKAPSPTEGPSMQWLLKVSQTLFGQQGLNANTTSSTYLFVHYVLRLAMLVLCLVGCFVQIGTIMRLYFSYPAIVFVDLHQMEKLLLPGITLCNENRVMRSKLRAYDSKFADEWNNLINKTGQQSKALKLYQQQLIDNLIRTMLTNLTVAQFMAYGNTVDDFLDVSFFKCASDKSHPTEKCIGLSNLYTTAQENGNCFTLFHKSTSIELEKNAINSGLSESAVVRGAINESVNIELSLKPFAPNEIIRFRVNFQEEEYTTLNEPVSGRFIIHDNRQLAVIREKGYRIEPGKYYIFYITKQTDELLPAPYFTDCRDYRQPSALEPTQIGGGNQTANTVLQRPASKSNCIIGCIARKAIATCNCWPPELPFLYTVADNATVNSLKWCDWRERPPIDNWQDKPSSLTWFQYCFNVHEADCNRDCKPDCRSVTVEPLAFIPGQHSGLLTFSLDRFRITKEEIEWPSRERIEHSEEREDLKNLRICCSVISIRYWTTEHKINKYRPRFELAEFTSYVGGLLSMWLGFSLFGFYGLTERWLVWLVKYFVERRQQRRKSARTTNVTRSSANNRSLEPSSSPFSSSKVQDLFRHRHTPTVSGDSISNWRNVY